MPMVNIDVIEHVFTPEQKRRMIERVTEAMVEIEGEPLREVTVVKINEIREGDWAIGGHCLTAADVRELQSGSPADR